MNPLGIISGTVLLEETGVFSSLREQRIETPFGEALLLRSARVVFCSRHRGDGGRHILPHLINHRANLQAMKTLGVGEILGVHSTGSLKPRLPPGTLVVPDDYLMLSPGPTVVRDEPVHITPALDAAARQRWLSAARECVPGVVDGGVYWQTAGPRLETRAEIAMMAHFADLVGMTMASEAIVAQELGIPYASLCSVDNYAHGIGTGALTMETIQGRARQNAAAIQRIIARCLEMRASSSPA